MNIISHPSKVNVIFKFMALSPFYYKGLWEFRGPRVVLIMLEKINVK